MFEFVVTKNEKYADVSSGDVRWVGFSHASVFKKKDRAILVSTKHGGLVEPFYGKSVNGSKTSVPSKQSQVNKSSPYKTI